MWTVEALLQLASPSEPQIRPDGGAYVYVLRGGIHMAALPTSAAPQRVASGSRPRWSPNSKLLAFIDKQIKVYDPATRSVRDVTGANAPITSFSWSPDNAAIAFLSPDAGPDADPIVADQDYKYSRVYWQPLTGGAGEANHDGGPACHLVRSVSGCDTNCVRCPADAAEPRRIQCRPLPGGPTVRRGDTYRGAAGS